MTLHQSFQNESFTTDGGTCCFSKSKARIMGQPHHDRVRMWEEFLGHWETQEGHRILRDPRNVSKEESGIAVTTLTPSLTCSMGNAMTAQVEAKLKLTVTVQLLELPVEPNLVLSTDHQLVCCCMKTKLCQCVGFTWKAKQTGIRVTLQLVTLIRLSLLIASCSSGSDGRLVGSS
jgi:hypothetical protein